MYPPPSLEADQEIDEEIEILEERKNIEREKNRPMKDAEKENVET